MTWFAIDLTATFTTWAAMAKYEESRKRSALIAPAIIILFCSGLSVVANYEDAAQLHPAQYASVSVLNNPALLFNPLLISAPPILVLLLILLVPSVLAQAHIKSAAEIEAEASQQEALIAADARIWQAKAKANATVMATRLQGLKETVSSLSAAPEIVENGTVEPDSVNDGGGVDIEVAPAAKMTKAMWQVLKLPERVQQSGVITPQEVAEVTGVSQTLARNLVKDVPGGQHTVDGRRGVSATGLIESLYDSRKRENYARAHSLEMALGIRKRTRTLQVVLSDDGGESEEIELGSGGERAVASERSQAGSLPGRSMPPRSVPYFVS